MHGYIKKNFSLCASFLVLGNTISCSTFSGINPLPYTPVITFSGIVGTDSLHYPGNRSYPNTCRLTNGCIRMYFYSDDYSQGSINHGDQMRIDVQSVDSQYITERNALFVMTRYDRGIATPTYNITPADTLNDYNNLSMRVESLQWRQGGAVSLAQMTAAARPLGQYAGEALIIKRGTIRGRIE